MGAVAGQPVAGPVAREERGHGWRLPALGVGLALVALVAIGRSGVRDLPAPSGGQLAVASPTAATPQAVAPTPTDQPTDWPYGPTPPPMNIAFLIPSAFESRVAPWPDRYADGIPLSVAGAPVHRVNETLNIATRAADGLSGSILIGGWYSAPRELAAGCAPPSRMPRPVASCGPGEISDSPLQRSGQVVIVDGATPIGDGPIVLRGVAKTRCSIVGNRLVYLCLYGITADTVVWSGDEYTAAGPIGVMPLLSRLGQQFDKFDPQPYHDQPGCQLPRPAQGYRSASGPIQMMFIFPSTADRFAQATAVLNGPPYGDVANGCDMREPLDGRAGWISSDNVLIRVRNYSGPAADTVRATIDVLAGRASH